MTTTMAANEENEKFENDYDNWSKEDLIKRLISLEAANRQQSVCKTCKHIKQQKLPKKKHQKEFLNVPTRHVLLKFLYMGWDYRGYASQVDTTETIEEHVMNALKRCCLIRDRESSNYHRCGRTDAGVSAFTQVISIDLRSKTTEPTITNTADEFDYCKMLNRLLPLDIRCYAWAHVSSNISSRFDCTSRSYNYFFPRVNLNISEMNAATKALEGTHDFRNLCKMDVGNGVVEFIRTIDEANIEPYNEDLKEFQIMRFRVKSRGFLWHQIRCIMAVLLLVGEGNESADVITQLLDVKKVPCKPQYHMAIPLPLALSTAEYEHLDLNWHISPEETQYLSSQLQGLWSQFAIKATLVREALVRTRQLVPGASAEWQRQTHLYSGVVAKAHVPLLKRATCQSLEERIQGVERKKRKLGDADDEFKGSKSSETTTSDLSIP